MKQGNIWTPDREEQESVRKAIESHLQAMLEANTDRVGQVSAFIDALEHEVMIKIMEKNSTVRHDDIIAAAGHVVRSSLRFHGLGGSSISDEDLEEKRKKAEEILGTELATHLCKEVHDEIGRFAESIDTTWKNSVQEATALSPTLQENLINSRREAMKLLMKRFP